MARRKITAGSTSITIPIFVQDTSSTIGAGLGSLVFNTANLAAKYRREGESSWTTITLATATVGTFTSGGFIADGGPVTGGYEFGCPNAVLASGAKWAEIQIYGATNMLPVLIELELDAFNYQTAVQPVDVTKVNSSTTAAISAQAFFDGSVLVGVAGTVTNAGVFRVVGSDFTATDDLYNGLMLVFTSGVNKGITRKISDYVGTNKVCNFTGSTGTIDEPFPSIPTIGDSLVVLGHG